MADIAPATTSTADGNPNLDKASASAPRAIVLRAPTHISKASQAAGFRPPPLGWLLGTWHVTHSTLPMWRSKRNVTINYAPIPNSSPSPSKPVRLSDTVSYQTLASKKIKTIQGIDTPSDPSEAGSGSGEWDWRGKGWLMIAGSHWEILGYGEEEKDEGGGGEDWVLTWFEKTLFTPSGIDIYCRAAEGLRDDTVKSILDGLRTVQAVGQMVGDLFEVTYDEDGPKEKDDEKSEEKEKGVIGGADDGVAAGTDRGEGSRQVPAEPTHDTVPLAQG